jgi:hypothetical protein
LINHCGANCTGTEITNYTADAAAVKSWLLGSHGPIQTNNCYNYYEDVPANTSNFVGAPCLDLAIFLFQQGSSFDSSFVADGESLLAEVSSLLSQSGPGSSVIMEEQQGYPNPTVDATARWAAANAWAAKVTTGSTSTTYRDVAFRAFNYSTYWLTDTTTKQVYVGSSSGCCTVITQNWYRADYPDVLPYFLDGVLTNESWGNSYGGGIF